MVLIKIINKNYRFGEEYLNSNNKKQKKKNKF